MILLTQVTLLMQVAQFLLKISNNLVVARPNLGYQSNRMAGGVGSMSDMRHSDLVGVAQLGPFIAPPPSSSTTACREAELQVEAL